MSTNHPTRIGDGLLAIGHQPVQGGRRTRRYLSRVERSFLTYLGRTPDTAALLRPA